MRAGALAVGLGLLGPGAARASPVETFGALPEDEARAGAAVASRDVAAAAFVNPAASAQPGPAALELGYRYEHLGLTLGGNDPGVMDARGVVAGFGMPFAWGPLRLGVSAGLSMPDQFIARISLEPATRPRFVMFENRVHRIAFNVAVSVALARGVYLGAGATVLADGAGNGVLFRVGSAPGRTVAEGALDVSLPLRAAPVAGLLVVPSERLAFGLRASGAISLNLALDVFATATIPGTSLDGDAIISVRGVDYYTPAELVGGAMVAPLARLRVMAELAYRRWSEAPSPSSDVGLLVRIGASPPTVAGVFPPPGYRDVVVPRVAAEVDLPTRAGALTVRAGYAFVPTPVPAQTGVTSYADGDRHVFAVGGSWMLGRRWGARWGVSLALGIHHVVPFVATRRNLLAPGGDLAGSGELVGGSLAARAEW